LFLIITISSSTKAFGSSGIDQTLNYFGWSSGCIVHLSNYTENTPFLYDWSFYIIELSNAIYISAG
jgi:hypothetical protein